MVRWNAYRVAALLSLAAALAVGAYAVSTGDARLVLLLFIPVFYGTGGLGALSILLVIAAFVLWTIGSFKALSDAVASEPWTRDPYRERPSEPGEPPSAPDEGRSRSRARGSGVILLGPIPIVFGTDKRLTLALVIATAVLMLLAVAFLFIVAPRV